MIYMPIAAITSTRSCLVTASLTPRFLAMTLSPQTALLSTDSTWNKRKHRSHVTVTHSNTQNKYSSIQD